MKVVYCAVGDRRKNSGANSSFVMKQMQFSYAAVRYFLSPKQASEQYGDLRANLDVQFVREVWDLLEDPVTSFFATQFGLVATTGSFFFFFHLHFFKIYIYFLYLHFIYLHFIYLHFFYLHFYFFNFYFK